MVAHFRDHLRAEVGAGVEHGQHDALHFQSGVELFAHELYGVHQLAHALERVVFALDGHQHAVRRGEGVERQKAQRGRAVDEDIVVAVPQGFERRLEQPFAALKAHKLHLRAGQFDAGGDEHEAVKAGIDAGVLGLRLSKQHFIDRLRALRRFHAQPAGGVALRVDVHQQRFFAGFGHAGA